MYGLWVNSIFKCPVTYPTPKPYITSLEDLLYPKGGVLPTLVENNMTNKPMGPKSIKETSIFFYIVSHKVTLLENLS